MRIPFVAGNWKMNNNVEQARSFVFEISLPLNAIAGVEKVICPPYSALLAVSAILQGMDIGLGAQNMHWEEKGAFTGEISPLMVAEFCKYVIIGHSERRAYFAESDENVNRKVHAAQLHNLVPIVCVGETLEENETGKTKEVIRRQVLKGMGGLDKAFAPGLVVAYEPVWAIGTGRASTGENASAVIQDVIRPALADMYDVRTAQAVRVLYGGSVTAANISEFFSQTGIDGALVGGASLNADEFVKITQAAVR